MLFNPYIYVFTIFCLLFTSSAFAETHLYSKQSLILNIILFILLVVLVIVVFVFYNLFKPSSFSISNFDLNKIINQIHSSSKKTNKLIVKDQKKSFKYLNTTSTKIFNNSELIKDEITESLAKINLNLNKAIDNSNVKFENTSVCIENISANIRSLEKVTTKKEQDLRRYQDGYDYIKIKNFVRGIIDIYEDVKEEALFCENDSLNDHYNLILKKIEILLRNNSIRIIDINSINEEYLSKYFDITFTHDLSQHRSGAMREIINEAVVIDINDEITKVIQSGRVSIFRQT